MSSPGGGGVGASSPGPQTHDEHRHPESSTAAAFRRLDELMSNQPPGARIPRPAPLNVQAPPADYAAIWDEMWGLWFPTTVGGAQ